MNRDDRIFWLMIVLLGIGAAFVAGLTARYASVISAPFESNIG